MARGIFGRKLGMTQVFTEDGRALGVTVLEVPVCRVLRRKSRETDGYDAHVIAIGEKKRASKPVRGQSASIGVIAGQIRELRDLEIELEPGAELPLDVFQAGEAVDATAISKGHGFAGGIKRWGLHRGPMSHGSKFHRAPGSLGARMSGGGGKVFKGRRLPGHYGHEQITVQNLTVVEVDAERRLILVKGALPGPRGALVRLMSAVKERNRA